MESGVTSGMGRPARRPPNTNPMRSDQHQRKARHRQPVGG